VAVEIMNLEVVVEVLEHTKLEPLQ